MAAATTVGCWRRRHVPCAEAVNELRVQRPRLHLADAMPMPRVHGGGQKVRPRQNEPTVHQRDVRLDPSRGGRGRGCGGHRRVRRVRCRRAPLPVALRARALAQRRGARATADVLPAGQVALAQNRGQVGRHRAVEPQVERLAREELQAGGRGHVRAELRQRDVAVLAAGTKKTGARGKHAPCACMVPFSIS